MINTTEALMQAEDEGLDLVQIAYRDNTPICQIMDFSKFKYEQKKKQSEMKKKQPKNTLKEIKLSPRIDKHDVDIKIRRTKEFLEDGCNVRISMSFRGRENNYREQGLRILDMFKIEGYNATDIKMEGSIAFMMVNQ